MANHKSALKRIRSDQKKQDEADKKLPELISMVDKLSKKNIIHSNKASRLKSSLTKHRNTLQ
jgi:small subunit ribosomal protein S20